ncbi:MAG: class I SAM-dependent methyltransferase [Deltaproteobacteria bacterium]
MPALTKSIIASLPANGPTDPIEYYRRPLVGWLFRERINLGLRMLPERRYERAMEVGFAAGAVLHALADSVTELHGIDLDADPAPVRASLASRGRKADLRQGSVYELPYESGMFDLVLSFSVFEHLHEYDKALGEVSRVLKPGGLFLLGMPAVNTMMDAGFRAIGFKGIGHHHVTTPAKVAACFASAGLRVVREKRLGLGPAIASVYYNWLLEKIA